MIRHFAWTLLATMLQVGSSMASETIVNVGPTVLGVPTGTPAEAIVRALSQAAAERQWYGNLERPGILVVSTTVRSHRATVEIGFDEQKYWINYRDSSNLDFTPKDLRRFDQATRKTVVLGKGPRIHPAYNDWVKQLSTHIALRVPAIVVDSASPGKPDVILIADELEKLDALRMRGVLTQEEFERQKAKLLGE